VGRRLGNGGGVRAIMAGEAGGASNDRIRVVKLGCHPAHISRVAAFAGVGCLQMGRERCLAQRW